MTPCCAGIGQEEEVDTKGTTGKEKQAKDEETKEKRKTNDDEVACGDEWHQLQFS